MFNFLELIKQDTIYYKQLSAGELLVTEYNCPLESKYQDIWSHHNYFVYCLDGKKTWHTSDAMYELTKDKCIFVRKGAVIVEQNFDAQFCLIIFFVPDDFICDTLRSHSQRMLRTSDPVPPIMYVSPEPSLSAFFHSILPYFANSRTPDPALLELKFKELLLMIADNPSNEELLSYFCTLVHQPSEVSLQRVMEDNFCYNLKLEEYARLTSRSLSAFKRDFKKLYSQPPGKWLLERRLVHAKGLLERSSKQVGDIAFESGFEDLSHFSRSFREFFGKTPIESRTDSKK